MSENFLFRCLSPVSRAWFARMNHSAIADTIWLWDTWHRVGILNIDVYIVGVTRSGALAGLSTQLVET